jgi:hypothetical protein
MPRACLPRLPLVLGGDEDRRQSKLPLRRRWSSGRGAFEDGRLGNVLREPSERTR